jgi:hypothetical protein
LTFFSPIRFLEEDTILKKKIAAILPSNQESGQRCNSRLTGKPKKIMNMDTYGDDRGSRSLGDISNYYKGLNYQALQEDETHDVTSSGEHVPIAQSTNKKLK